MRRLLYIGLCLLLVSCTQTPDFEMQLHECAPMPFKRASATCFIVDGKAYIFGGRDERDSVVNELWRYTPATDSWEDLGTTPLTSRVNATACVTDGKVYIGLGFKGGYFDKTSYLRDWWEYTPHTGKWKRLADYPNGNTDRATAFADEGELYVGYGFSDRYARDMFRYTIETDSWDSIDVQVPFLGNPPRSFGGTGCTCQGRHFMGTGYFGNSLDWWAELVEGTHWEERTRVPGRTRTLAATAASDNYIYLSAGLHYGGVNTTGAVLQDIRRYDPVTDKWQYVAVLPQGIFNHFSFAAGKRIYIGGGETDETPDWPKTDKLYYIEE